MPANNLAGQQLLRQLANPEAIDQGFGSSRVDLTSPIPTNRLYTASSPSGAMSARSQVSAADSLLGSVNKNLAKRVEVDYEVRKTSHHERVSKNIRRHVDL